MNAMIARAMEVCHRRGMSYLVYSKFRFGNKKHDEMAEFKKRNGFVEITYPRYFVPLTLRGRVAFGLKLHRGLLGILPSGVIQTLSRWRSKGLALVHGHGGADDEKASAPASSPTERGETV